MNERTVWVRIGADVLIDSVSRFKKHPGDYLREMIAAGKVKLTGECFICNEVRPRHTDVPKGLLDLTFEIPETSIRIDTGGVTEKEVVETIYVGEIGVTDPETGNTVEVEIHKDPQSNGMFGIDAQFLDQMRSDIPSPFNENTILHLSEPD